MRWLQGTLALGALLALVWAGCSGQKAPVQWQASVAVLESSAVVAIDVAGLQLGRDYHPHLRLNGGPEVMMYAPTYTFTRLEPGSYRLLVELAGVDHKPLPGGRKELSFAVP